MNRPNFITRLLFGTFGLLFLAVILSACDDPVSSVRRGQVCEPLTCAAVGLVCGDWANTNGCGGILKCSECTGDLSCNLGGRECQDAPADCTPATCEDIRYQCGNWEGLDGCGGGLDCGSCSAQQSCNLLGQCEDLQICIPMTCDDLNYICGDWADGCGGAVSCGDCDQGLTCTENGVCDDGSCEPLSCSDLGYACGTWQNSDGCEGSLDCGDCNDGFSCDDLGVCIPPVCIPISCEDTSYVCGTWPDADGCGGILNCSDCIGSTECNSDGLCESLIEPGCTESMTDLSGTWDFDYLNTAWNPDEAMVVEWVQTGGNLEGTYDSQQSYIGSGNITEGEMNGQNISFHVNFSQTGDTYLTGQPDSGCTLSGHADV